MIELENDLITLVYKKEDIKLRRSFRMDKDSGEVRITDYDITNDKPVKDIRCDIFDLDSFQNLDKYAQQVAENLIEARMKTENE